MLMKRKIILAIVVISLCCFGCSSYSIDDAYSKAVDNKFAVNSTEVVTKESFSVAEIETNIESIWSINSDSGKQKQNILKYGEYCRYGDFSLSIEDVQMSTNTTVVNAIANEQTRTAFLNYITNIWDDTGSKFDDEGNVSKSEYTCLFIKIKIKNESYNTIR